MANPLADANVGALPNTGVDPGPMSAQGPQVDAGAMGTPPEAPAAPTGPASPGAGAGPGETSPEAVREAVHKLSAVSAAYDALLAKGTVTRKEVVDASIKLVSRRIMSAQSMAQTLKDLPQDPADVREWLQRIADGTVKSEHGLLQLLQGIRAEGHPLADKLGPGLVMPPGQEDQGGQPPTMQ